MPNQPRLPPCPFCGGPPKPIVTKVLNGGGIFKDSELQVPGGLYVNAVVYCHECGANGPSVSDFAHDRARCNELQAQAERLWTLRDKRNGSLYGGIDPDEKSGASRASVRKTLEPHLVNQICGLRRHQVKDAVCLLLDYIDATVIPTKQ